MSNNYAEQYQGIRQKLSDKIIAIDDSNRYVGLVLRGLVSDDECQRVIDYIDSAVDVRAIDVLHYAFEIERQRFEENRRKESSYEPAYSKYLRRIFPEYPNLMVKKIEISFVMRSVTSNTPLIYSILDSFSEQYYAINGKEVRIKIASEEEILHQLSHIYDVLLVVGNWKSTSITVNETSIDTSMDVITQINHIFNYLLQKNKNIDVTFHRDISQVRDFYQPREKKINRKTCNLVTLSREELVQSLEAVVDKYVDVYGRNKAIDYYDVDQYNRVIVIEDSFVVSFQLVPEDVVWKDNESYLWKYSIIYIQELTENEIFKFSWVAFQRLFSYSGVVINYLKYRGTNYYDKNIDNYEKINNELPFLELNERQNNYLGELYHLVILKMIDVDGNSVYGVGYTKSELKKFIKKLCKELQEKGTNSIKYGASCLPFQENRKYITAFLSWQGKKKLWRIENKFSFYSEDVYVRNDIDIKNVAWKRYQAACSGAYASVDFEAYHKPENPWKSEELVYDVTKQLYDEYQVIYQYKPHYLRTENGNMSYDVYICGLKIAIEYQGKQHFEPVGYFGGEENYNRQKQRDELKAEISKERGVKLIYVNYWEDITSDLIKRKVEAAIQERNEGAQ